MFFFSLKILYSYWFLSRQETNLDNLISTSFILIFNIKGKNKIEQIFSHILLYFLSFKIQSQNKNRKSSTVLISILYWSAVLSVLFYILRSPSELYRRARSAEPGTLIRTVPGDDIVLHREDSRPVIVDPGNLEQ